MSVFALSTREYCASFLQLVVCQVAKCSRRSETKVEKARRDEVKRGGDVFIGTVFDANAILQPGLSMIPGGIQSPIDEGKEMHATFNV